MTSQQPPEGLSADEPAMAAFRAAQSVYRGDHDHVALTTSWESTTERVREGWRKIAAAARSTSPAPDPKAGEREQVAEAVERLARIDSRPYDERDRWELIEVAEHFATRVRTAETALAEARSEVERLKQRERRLNEVSAMPIGKTLDLKDRAEAAEAQLVGAREALTWALGQIDPDLVDEARFSQALSMSILRGDKGCSLGAIEAPACGSPADCQPSGGAE